MAHREIGQLSLADGLVAERGRNESLERIAALVDWAPIGALLSGLHASVRGPKSYPPLMMLKALLLQQWHGLGDVDLEAMLGDRLAYCVLLACDSRCARPENVAVLPGLSLRPDGDDQGDGCRPQRADARRAGWHPGHRI